MGISVWREEGNHFSLCAENRPRHFGICYVFPSSQAREVSIIFHILQMGILRLREAKKIGKVTQLINGKSGI